ncbi:efflux RND transporter periplasmic adaptor subunit [Simiduia litorea]|uniref:efflux RND transporter periplasmic adaptor subunit n=1 Tax=Simiduia litorea TaxID=1435348 RepID=UPI0036F293A0
MRLPALLIALVTISACSEKPVPKKPVIQPAKVMVVQTGDSLTREIPGVVRASQRVDLAFQVSGRLVKFALKEGQAVKEGELLGSLDSADYKSAADAARADRDQAKGNFERAQELIEKDFISKMDFDKLKANYEIAKSKMEQAEKAYSDTELKAPFTGVVARKYVDNFAEVQANKPVISLQDKENLEIVVNISENILARHAGRTDLSIAAHFDSVPDKTFALFIKEFTTEANPTTQTFQYVLGIKDRQGVNLLPGMTANVSVTDNNSSKEFTPIIPLHAITTDGKGNKAVWLVDADNKVKHGVVELGFPVGSDSIQITQGLSEGDVIVTAGLSALSEGLEIKPMTEVRF